MKKFYGWELGIVTIINIYKITSTKLNQSNYFMKFELPSK